MWTAARSLILLVIPLACFGQLSPQAKAIFQAASVPKAVSGGGGGAFAPTNLPSMTAGSCVAWWDYGYYYTNGSSQAQLPDLSGNGVLLQNQGAASSLPGPTNSSGLRYLGTPAQYLTNRNFSLNQPLEVDVVAMINATIDFSTLFDQGPDNLGRVCVLEQNSTPVKWWMLAGVNLNGIEPVVTAQTIMYTFQFNTTASAMYTNKVASAMVGNAGTTNMRGFTLGNNYTFGQSPNCYILGVAVYSVTNSGTVLSNLYYYFKTTRGFPLP